MYDLVNFNFGAIYGVIWLAFTLALLAAVLCLIVFLISATKASAAIARYRHVQTELLLADAAGGGPYDDARPTAAP